MAFKMTSDIKYTCTWTRWELKHNQIVFCVCSENLAVMESMLRLG